MYPIASHWLNYIDGDWVDSAQHLSVNNPGTAEPLATIAQATVEDAERALLAARRCADSGELTRARPAQRVSWLLRIAEEIRAVADEGAWVLCQENGKSINDARDEFIEAARYFEYYAGMADKIEGTSIPLGNGYMDFTVYDPMGVSAQIVPWNFPVSICARSLAPALAAGNAVVIKSPELSPLGMCVLVRAIVKAGLPQGAINLICGRGREVGAHLVSSAKVDQIVFTGSVPTGQSILRDAAANAIPSVMELGGKSAAIAFADVDRKQLLASVKNGIFFNAGQVCSAMSRLLVQREIYEDIVQAVVELAEGLSVGLGQDNPDLTPVVSAAQLAGIETLCRRAVDEGAVLATGGEAHNELAGHFMLPTVFRDVRADMCIAQEEVFGPVLAVIPFDSEEQAIEIANGTDFGLVAGVFTQDISRAMRCVRRLRAGQVFVNEWYAGGIETPFGGVGLSGFGREKGQEALYSYVRTKNIAIRVAGE
ncbi:aldehyde dehydrogenase family protein [Pseudomonas chengduensis]|jgi:aldehyde dehydrogenase (NAD+)|uniref:Aldehyde dehydrogenase (NAD+) n=1 Tax=Ectopseudomonas chengduensis TaxID=489632 RepID=A0A1G6V3F4_9GAMM|nr:MULTISPECIES: aldehyde dehydrogenase family protein [Pseudomonas]KQO31025.1 aldehyde dehydrogenase [Pseudomonas sp. Leaf83]MBP3063909.1 aldehyde dehydrogenase family protein [Pseudomonas chengduensis]MDH0959206.1 aldehyde dehydrogenase family protein [Pseudomonas chengduensis]MDH1536184.1 aldehyde dehydrogenase family protein [Pseudomonas chengduensis]NNB76907.1 aldehyde dehydrogenase family protein [Pseudomonas chengduensis]